MFDDKLRELEILIKSPVLGLFNFIAVRVSYTFAVAFLTSLGGFMIAAYIAIFLYATVNFEQSGTGMNFIILFCAVTLLLYAPGYYLHFGALFKLGLICFDRSLLTINLYTRNNRLEILTDENEARQLLMALERLPMSNMKASIIYPSLVMCAVVVQEFIIGTIFNAAMLLLGIASAIFVYVIFAYVSAELLTGSSRRKLKQLMVREKISFKESIYFSIRKKFLFLSVMVLIALFELTLMFHFSAGRFHFIVPILYILFAVAIVTILLFLFLTSIEESLNEIQSSAEDLGRGGAGKLYLSSMDRELVTLSRGFIAAAYEVNDVRQNLERKVRERTEELNVTLKKLKEKDDVIQSELNMASDIQHNILPGMPMTFNCMKAVAFYRAMGKVGGDFFDIFPLKNDHHAVVIADVSGHGVPAALITFMAKISFAEAARRHRQPKDIFKRVNAEMIKVINAQDYLTAFLMIIAPDNTVYYGNASHNKALVIRKETFSLDEWDSNGLMVGMIEDGQYEQKSDSLEYGDRVFLYTDGLTESRNPDGEEFGLVRLKQQLHVTMDMPLEIAKENIIENWEEYIGDFPVTDDVSFLILELDPTCRNLPARRESGLAGVGENTGT